MIITRTPFRISLFGGSTDFPEWYMENGGQVLSMAINKYCYINCRELPPFFNHKYRLMYAKVENAITLEDIQHPVVKAVIKYFDINEGLEIHHDADLPAKSGTGSSSAFTVGLVNALSVFKKRYKTQKEIAWVATHIERNILKENVGHQDQLATAFGGFNKITFSKEAVKFYSVSANPENLVNRMMLFYTGLERISSDIIKTYRPDGDVLTKIARSVDLAEQYIAVEDYEGLGMLLRDSWHLKKQLSDKISNGLLDEIIKVGIAAGAYGGKVLGAGAGGCVLFIVEPEYQSRVLEALSEHGMVYIPFKINKIGTEVLYTDEN